MDDETMWAADRVVAPTPGSTITIPEIANEFAIKVGGIFLYKTPNQAYQLLEDKVLLKLDWAKNQKAKSSLKKTVVFAVEGSSNSKTDKIMARIDVMTMKMDAQYKEFQSRSKQLNLDDEEIPILAHKQSVRPSGSLPSNTQPNPKDSSSKPYQPPQAQNEHVNVVFTQSGKSYDLPVNPNDQNDSETPINFDSDNEDDEPTPKHKPKYLKPVKETSMTQTTNQKSPSPPTTASEKKNRSLNMENPRHDYRAVHINVTLDRCL
ncbi:hypothetical protein Tco_0386939 [Tanacetum coccineum]